MSVITVPKSTSVSVKLNTGLDAKGNPIVKGVSLGKVRTAASASGIYAVATDLIPCLAYPVLRVERTETETIEDDGE